MDFCDSKVLIVGGAGFVGSNLIVELLNRKSVSELWVIDNLLSSDISNLPNDKRVNFLFGSVCDQKILDQIPENIDYIFHLACYHGNQSSIIDPLSDHENNTYTTLKLLEHIHKSDRIKKCVYSAAGCAVSKKTYDSPEATVEDAAVSLFHDSPYSISKLIGELYGNYYYRQHSVPFVKARFQNVYGPRELLGAGRWRGNRNTVWRNVIPTFIWKALNQESLPLDNGGNTSRDFIFVKDIVRGLIACALLGKPGESYNLASGKETSIHELAVMINDIAGNSSPLDLKPARAWDRSGRRYGDTRKTRDSLGFVADVDIADGLKETIIWTQSNRERILQIMQNHAYFLPEIKKYYHNKN